MESRLHSSDDFPAGRQNADHRQRATVYYDLVVHQNLELTVTCMNFFDVDRKLSTESRRHTDGVYAGHSIPAIFDHYGRHELRPSDGRMVPQTSGGRRGFLAIFSGQRLAPLRPRPGFQECQCFAQGVGSC